MVRRYERSISAGVVLGPIIGRFEAEIVTIRTSIRQNSSVFVLAPHFVTLANRIIYRCHQGCIEASRAKLCTELGVIMFDSSITSAWCTVKYQSPEAAWCGPADVCCGLCP